MHSQVVTMGRHIITSHVIISAHAVAIHIVKSEGAPHVERDGPVLDFSRDFFIRLSRICLSGGRRLFLDVIILTCGPEKLEDPWPEILQELEVPEYNPWNPFT